MRCQPGRVLLAAVLLVSFVSPAASQSLVTTRHWSGQGIAPIYEGWDRNPDGTYNMWFGYLNRTFEETLDLPAGETNRFEPGPADRGQPTFFDTRRHKDVFRVVVPRDFGDRQKLTWSVTVRGKTETTSGTLNPTWQIDRRRATRGGNIDNIESNTPPVVNVPAPRTVPAGTPLSLEVFATDDGLPRRRGVSPGMTVEWSKYRGPGQVALTPAKQPLADGKASATATFSEPGEYEILAVVDDGSGESAGDFSYHCCWTNARILVTVTGGPGAPASARAVAAAAPPTYAADVEPIFRSRCVQCHHEGTGAPMSLVAFHEVRPWARSIRQRVASREMPPWHLDKTVGIRKYKNDLSLTEREIDTIVRWVDAGAPAGDLSRLPPAPTFAPEDAWRIGKPDLVVKLDRAHTMYPAGPDWWLDYFADTGLTEDRWIKAMEIRPSNRKIVHHVVAFAIEPDPAPGMPASGAVLQEYAVGKYGETFNDDTSRLLKAGTRLRFDMHYFPIGEEQIDQTEMAFIFHPKGYTPKYEVRPMLFRNLPNDELEIPPNSVVRHDGYFRLQRPARIDAFQPHMHMRGKAMTLEAILPNNRIEVLSSVNNFDFNWHVGYLYAEDAAPLLPANTMLHIIGIHDNTAANKRNPDPNMWAGFGERSVDDMLQVWLNVVYLDEAEYNRLVEERRTRQATAATGGQQP